MNVNSSLCPSRISTVVPLAKYHAPSERVIVATEENPDMILSSASSILIRAERALPPTCGRADRSRTTRTLENILIFVVVFTISSALIESESDPGCFDP